jgi:uncharacterized protein YkwD
MLAACGGGDGGGNNSSGASAPARTTASAQEPNAPQATGNTATDGLNWFNFRRQQVGIQQVLRNAQVDAAAQGHSDYQKANNTITHEQIPGRAGFTGRTTGDRLAAAGYQFAPNASYAYGEVISSSSDPSGFNAAEDLIAAIYHRFVIFEPMFKEAGAGSATASGGSTYFTTDFVANGLNTGLGAGTVVIYPFANQLRVPRNFFSDHEAPDPVPDRNEVGYPISVHVNITSVLNVQSFNVRPRGGVPIDTLLLTHARDAQTPLSAAAIIPLNPLSPPTIYVVQFTGRVDGLDVIRNWSFTTQ